MSNLITDEHKEILFKMSLNQYKTISRLKLYFGHNIYQMNIDDGTVTEAKYDIEKIVNPKNKAISKKIHLFHSPGYIYVSALNLTNAHKKFAKIVFIVDRMVRANRLNKPQTTPSSTLKGDDKQDDDKPGITPGVMSIEFEKDAFNPNKLP